MKHTDLNDKVIYLTPLLLHGAFGRGIANNRNQHGTALDTETD